eukprot:963687-Rhodomonas_salina.2
MLAAFALTCRDAGSGFNAGVFVTPARKPMLRSYRGDIARVGLKPAAFSTATSLRMMSSEPETKTDVAETIAKKPYEETQAALVQKYVDFLDWKSDTNGFEMQEWRVDNREIKMKSQNITKETAPDRAMEAILRTREKYIAAFMDDGVNRTSAEARADNFLEDSVRSCDIIWKDEKDRFVSAEEDAEKRSKFLVVLANIFVFTPLVLAFLSTMPIGPVVEMTKYYVSNNCIPIGGIKCNGEGAQGQKLPNVMKMFTPPKKIVRTAPSMLNRIEPAAEEAAAPASSP